jgi:Ca2+-binding RTX toxin-like protein
MFQNSWKKLLARKETSRRTKRASARPSLHHFRPRVERLEERSVPTIVFANQFGTEQLLPQGGSTISSPSVYLIFWGSYWETVTGSAQQGEIITAAQSLCNSAYFTGQQQYGTNGIVNYGGFDNHVSDPTNGFSQQNITDVIHNDIDNGMVPDSENTGDSIYVVLTPPGITSGQGSSVGGYNSFTYQIEPQFGFPPFTVDNQVYCWVGGGSDPNTFTLDTYTKILSHELSEAITDPQSFRPFFPFIGFNGYRVNPGAIFPNPPPNSNQIADYEAQNYSYRLGGVQVQSYWSDQDQNFIVPDANQQKFLVINGGLYVNGDQFGNPYNDLIFIRANAQGGVFVSLNGESVSFDPGAINAVNVSTGGGNDTVFVLKSLANVPVNIQLGSGQDNVFVNPLNGLGDIQGTVTVNGGGASTLTVDDSGDPGTFAEWTMTGSSVTETGSAVINYSNMQNIVVDGGGPNVNNQFGVQSTEAGGATTINTGDGNADHVYVDTTTGPLTINDGAGSEDVTSVSSGMFDLDTVPGRVTVHGQGNSDELALNDQNHTQQAQWLVSGDRVIRISGISGTGNHSTAEVDYSGIHHLVLYGGLGAAAFDLSPQAHNLDELPALVKVLGRNVPINMFTAEDGNNSLSSRWDVTTHVVTRTHSSPAEGTRTITIEYFEMQTVTLNGGSGDNTCNVMSTGAPTTTILNTGAGNDTINVGAGNSHVLDHVLGPVTVNGQGGSDTLNLNDQDSSAAFTFSLTATSATRDNIALISYAGMNGVAVNGGSGGDTFNVTGISHSAPFTINGGAGNDTVNLTSPDLSDNPNLNHQVIFNGNGGTDVLNLNDQATAVDGNYILDSNSLSETNAPLLTLNFDATLENLNVNAGSGNDTFEILRNLVTAVAIDGGAGTNSLNYGPYVGDITVDLPLGVATGLSGGITNIQNVYGSIGNDILVGDANLNFLQGGTGRNLVIGGAGSDHVIGGLGDNMLIGGTTDFDQNLTALDDFMTEWLRTDLNFHQRVGDIMTGGRAVPGNLPPSVLNGTSFRLDPQTVHDDQVTDFLVGSMGIGNDWYFFNPSFDALSNKKMGDHFTVVKN